MDLLDPREEKVDRPLKHDSFKVHSSNLWALGLEAQSLRPQFLDQNLLSTDRKRFVMTS